MKAPSLNLPAPVKPRAAKAGGVPHRWLRGVWNRRFLSCLLLGACCFSTRAAFVYETAPEFITAGDFDGDGRVDALVLDKLTGNVRVGYQNANGALDWPAPRATGADGASALAVGRFAETNRESIAVTAVELNQIRVINLSNPSNSPSPTIINPPHAGTSLLVGLDAPFGVTASHSWTAAGAHDPGLTIVDVLAYALDGGSASFQDQFVASGYLNRLNPLTIGTNKTTLVAGLLRGTNDTFAAYSYASQSNVLYRVGLPAGTEYVPGYFQWSRDSNAVSVMLFYVPGQSNLIVQRIIANGNSYVFGAPMISTFASAIQRVYFVDEGTNGLGVIKFGDGVKGVRPAGTNDELLVSFSVGSGAAGNVAGGVIPLGPGKFALLSSASNLLASTYAQVFTKSGGSYVQTSSNALPAVTSVATRGNVWLFQIEPFVSSAASLIGLLSAPAWSSTISGLPGTLSVRVESDGGTTTGLSNPSTNNLGAPPAGTVYVLPNQYRDDVSFFGYGPAHAPDASVVTVSPPPGFYGGPIQIAFAKQNATDNVQFRKTANEAWQPYGGVPFLLTNDATIQFYGQTTLGARGRTQSATYALGNIAVSPEPLATLPGSGTNPPAVNPTIPHISTSGTVFYGRRAHTTVPTIFYTANDVVLSYTPPGPPTIFANLPLYTSPQGLVFDTSGNLFVAGGGNVSKITPAGVVSVFATMPPGSFGGYGLAIDAGNNLYLAGAATLEIKKITPGGAVSTYATLPTGTTGLAIDSGGNLYKVGGGYDVLKIPAGGGPASIYATLGGNNLYGLAFDASGYLYASDLTQANIYKIPPGGGSYTTIGPLIAGSDGLTFDQSGNLYAAQPYADAISVITPSGTASVIGTSMGNPRYLVVKPDPFAQQNTTVRNDPRGPTIWAINLDGSGETFITTGREPRVSRDGRWMAFWRENDPLTNQFSLWLRDLPAGQESRWDTRATRYIGFDWQRDNTNLIFAVDGLFWRIGLTTPPVAFPLGSDLRQGTPAVNPVDGRVALQVIYPGSTGLYLAPSNLTSRQNLGVNIYSPRRPAWSPDGTRIAVADDPNISQLLDAGQNLWVVKFGTQTNVYQITALTGGTNGFPNGAVWSPGGNKLVTAGRIGGVNGLWVIPVATDGSACHCQPELISTLPGDPIDFVGSVLSTSATESSASYANLGLFIRLDPTVMVVYWSTNYDGYSLESANGLPAGLSWSAVTGPYFRAGPYFEYREARTALAGQKYFRLHFPGVLVLTPPEPPMAMHLEPDAAVLNWPLNYVGYSVEAATNLSPPVLWKPLSGGAINTNGAFEYRRVLPGPPQEFYRLRGP